MKNKAYYETPDYQELGSALQGLVPMGDAPAVT